MVDIRRCQAVDVPALMEFINTHWKAGHVLATNRSLLDWQHRREDGSYNYLLAWKDDDLLGVLGYIPTARFDPALAADNKLWLALWKVREDHNVPMLGLRLLKALETAEPNTGLAVSGINLTHPPMYQALGYRVADVVQYVLVRPDAPRSILQTPADFEPPRPSGDSAQLQPLDADRLAALKLVLPLAAPDKSPTYFLNRYLRHPFYTYRVFSIVVDDVPKALIATRVARHQHSAVLRLVDFCGDATVLPECGAAFERLMADENCEYMDFWQHGIDPTLLQAAGFFAIDREGETIAPNFFEPFLAKNGRIVCAVKFSHPNSSDAKNTDAVPTVVCRADGDQDRPNQLLTA